jgi:hypothetical protein
MSAQCCYVLSCNVSEGSILRQKTGYGENRANETVKMKEFLNVQSNNEDVIDDTVVTYVISYLFFYYKKVALSILRF